jgi:hypothetical protein
MANIETTGGGTIDSGDKRIERKVVVATGGADPAAPGGTGRLTNISITQEPGGIRRGVFEYTQGGAGDANYNAYGKKVELMGGSREVPIYNHPNFAALTREQILSVQKAVEEKQDRSFTNSDQQKLFEFLSRGTEYFLSPSVVARVSEIESSLPAITGLCNVDNPSGISAPSGTFWVLTGISASPVGDKYEITREYTSIPSGWDDVEFLYTNW